MFLMLNVTDLATIGFLVFLEGILSVDNALVLALLVRGLPKEQQKKALTFGVWGAFLFRGVSLFFLSYLMGFDWIKVVGGGYLLWIALAHFLRPQSLVAQKPTAFNFWRTVLMVELMDVAFSVDSILAAVSLSQNYWVVLIGGVLGIITMRFAASAFIHLIELFPRLERTAYLLVFVIGLKLAIQGLAFNGVDFHAANNPASWLFWGAMLFSIVQGFKRPARIRDASFPTGR